jgi:hypothetical protein
MSIYLNLLILLVALSAPALGADPIRVLLVTGGHSHEPTFYSVFDDPRFRTDVNPHPNAFQKDFRSRVDVLVLYDMVDDLKDETKRKNVLAFVESGKGIVVLHHALGDNANWPWWYEEVVGGHFRFPSPSLDATETYKHDQTVPVTVVKKHPVTSGVDNFTITDETYRYLWISPKVDILLRTSNPTSDGPVAWIGPSRQSRVVYLQLGHDGQAYKNPNYRRLVANSILWAAGR